MPIEVDIPTYVVVCNKCDDYGTLEMEKICFNNVDWREEIEPYAAYGFFLDRIKGMDDWTIREEWQLCPTCSKLEGEVARQEAAARKRERENVAQAARITRENRAARKKRQFKGEVSNVKDYEKALTQMQVEKIYEESLR
jgi:hypothetical protein